MPTTTHKKGMKRVMTALKERHLMIIRALNNPDRPMQPITREQLNALADKLGLEQLAADTSYLIKIGLIEPNAASFSIDRQPFFNIGCMALTAKGFDYANTDTIGSELNAVTIKIHKNTLEQLETIINNVNLPQSEKKTLLKLIKEKGAESVVGKCVDTLFANAGAITQILSELAKSISS
ncbi:hypothetical protein [Arsenophonus sp.]|uniref:hypothetical protein n=1 Tax=Arsenophonus sp. TaxID=1872640 RepID=UPI002863797B|nr:hypothetical protein [Arsenophonus sp.]MDR5616892.1 hypothetical protein [Arsenophonus sp.]